MFNFNFDAVKRIFSGKKGNEKTVDQRLLEFFEQVDRVNYELSKKVVCQENFERDYLIPFNKSLFSICLGAKIVKTSDGNLKVKFNNHHKLSDDQERHLWKIARYMGDTTKICAQGHRIIGNDGKSQYKPLDMVDDINDEGPISVEEISKMLLNNLAAVPNEELAKKLIEIGKQLAAKITKNRIIIAAGVGIIAASVAAGVCIYNKRKNSSIEIKEEENSSDESEEVKIIEDNNEEVSMNDEDGFVPFVELPRTTDTSD